MKLDNLRGLENMCFDIDSYGVSDAMRKVPARELFKAASAAEKREIARHYDQTAVEMRGGAAETAAALKDTYSLQMDTAVNTMAGKIMFFDSPDLSREMADYLEAARPYERGVKGVTRLFNDSETYSQQASHLRWSARKDEFIGFVHKVGDGLKALLHPT
jgi:hypothetical protein